MPAYRQCQLAQDKWWGRNKVRVSTIKVRVSKAEIRVRIGIDLVLALVRHHAPCFVPTQLIPGRLKSLLSTVTAWFVSTLLCFSKWKGSIMMTLGRGHTKNAGMRG